MSMENWWNDNDREKIKVLTEKPVPTQLFPQQTTQVTNTSAMPQMIADSLSLQCGSVLSGQEHAGVRWC